MEEIKTISKEQDSSSLKIRKWLIKPWVAFIITLILVAGTVYAGQNYFNSGEEKDNNKETQEESRKKVKTMILDLSEQNNFISAVGTVKPETIIEVVALSQGTVRALFFDIGEKVYINQVLADLHNNTALTSNSNAQINYFNMQNNIDAIIRLTDGTIRQAEIGIQNALKSIGSAEIALKTAEDNLTNTISLQEKNNTDTKDKAIILFSDYLNTVNNTLEQVNYIIKAEGDIQLDGVATTLSIKNPQHLSDAKNYYLLTRNAYIGLNQIKPSRNTVVNNIKEVINALELTKLTVDNTIKALNSTISNPNFSQSSMNTQLTIFSTFRSAVVSAQTSSKTTLDSLENLKLANKKEKDALDNAISSAKKQLELAQIGHDIASASLESARQSQEQQLIGAQTSLDSAEGQLNLSNDQIVDLTINAPMGGTITGKFIELGGEVAPGQKIAEVQKIDKVKIEISLPSEDIYRIEVGQKVIINDKLEAEISLIDPTADSVTRKVRAEILFDNKENKLITGTFVDVIISIKEQEKVSPESVSIPLKAVTIAEGENYVFVNDKGIAKKVVVEVGKTEGALIEILSGLNDGNELIVEGGKNLEEDESIEISNL
ncbi:MAG: efflux RND transporter periplasmic adaptor subunit [Patescibacteria group bacterium]